MNGLLNLLFVLTGVLATILFALLSYASIRELKPRAFLIAVSLELVFVFVWFGGFIYSGYSSIFALIFLAASLLFTVLFFVPVGKTDSIMIGPIDEKVDERDSMFAREEYVPDSDRYGEYYSMRPELKEGDDKIRRLPALLQPGGKFYDKKRSAEIGKIFETIKSMTTDVDGEVNPSRERIDACLMSEKIKNRVIEMGADEVGIAKLNPMFVYSHVGRGPEKWGSYIINKHKFAVVYTMEMDYFSVEKAPALEITEEAAEKYLRLAEISVELAKHIREELGVSARAHISDSNYQIMLPPVAHDAGLGELGRHGYIISRKSGARIRLGAVTTDLPLLSDKSVKFGVQNFCETCLKCSVNCPSGAIPSGNKHTVRGVEKWPTDVERCMHYWRVLGTDCGLCMKVCPFSHPGTLVHNFVRVGIKRSSFARWTSLRGDDLFYGKRINVEYEASDI